jgi:C4-dicarboxylate-specific signal transduction histidine kinase
MSSADNREAAFVAKVTASTTHEFRNVFAIVKESAGLIEDLLSVTDRGGLDREKLLRAVRRIEAQVTRGADLVTALNRFAHCLDRPDGPLSLQQQVRQVAFLSQRAARRGKHRLQVEEGDVDAPVVLDALRLQMVLFEAVACCVEVVPEGGVISIGIEGGPDAAAARFSAMGDGLQTVKQPTAADGWDRVVEAVEALGGRTELLDDGWGFRLVLPVEHDG